MSGSDKTENTPLTVSGIRAGIDSLDEQIQTLITERAEACAQIARLKHQQPDAISSSEDQLASDAQILRKIAERNSGPVDDHSTSTNIPRDHLCKRSFGRACTGCLSWT